MVKQVYSFDFKKEIENGTTVVNFYSDLGSPSKLVAPIFNEIKNEVHDKAKFLKVNIDQSKDLAMKFGYFISSNFVKNEEECSKESEKNLNNVNSKSLNSGENIDKNSQCDILVKCNKENSQSLNDEKSRTKNTYSNKLQIIVVTSIGTISLILLLCVRNSNEIYAASVPIISQLRDIVCGCIGFLLGSPSNKR